MKVCLESINFWFAVPVVWFLLIYFSAITFILVALIECWFDNLPFFLDFNHISILWPTGDFVPFAAPPSTPAATTTTCTSTGPPTPQFSYHDINVYALAGLAPHININANVSVTHLQTQTWTSFSFLLISTFFKTNEVSHMSFLHVGSSDPSAPGSPSAEAVRASVHRASCPGVGASSGRSFHQDRHDHLWTDHQEGLCLGFGGVTHARRRSPHDEEPDCRHGHDHLSRAPASEHQY